MEDAFEAAVSSSSSSKKQNSGGFQGMDLHQELLNGLNRMGYRVPTPVQRKALPIALAGMDMVCMARTGSGKTCVFLLPLLQRLKEHKLNFGVRGIVLSPTRELAVQTFKFAQSMGKFSSLRVISVIGGEPIEPQFNDLANHPDVLIGTPGRLMHHLREISSLKLKNVEYLVFDEADRLFEMGFAEQLNEIVSQCPEERQTLLFSATMPKQLIQFSRAGLRDPQLVRLDTDAKMSADLRLGFFFTRSNEKVAALLYLVRKIIPPEQQTIVFTATRHHSEFLHLLFQRLGISSTVVYGSMDQVARSVNLSQFRDGKVSYLIVTDLAARGLDVPLLNNVINFHFPPSSKLFVHRCGRAARQGRTGFAFSLVEPEELAFMFDVHSFLGRDMSTEYIAANRPDFDTMGAALSCARNAYTLGLWTPEEVHTGIFPQDVLDEENDYLKAAVEEDEQLKISLRISENGMKQYRRTRSEATRDGVKKAKTCIKETKIRNIHPLIIGMDPSNCHEGIVEKANFVRLLQTFRPRETVFESGIGTGTTNEAARQVKKRGSKEAKGAEIMHAFRKVTASSLERTKPKVALAEEVLESDDDDIGEVDDGGARNIGYSGEDWSKFTDGLPDDDEFDIAGGGKHTGEDVEEKGMADDDMSVGNDTYIGRAKRLSKADRKKIKKSNLSIDEFKSQQMASLSTTDERVGGKQSSSSFQDKRHYMTYGTEDETHNFIEDSMQPQSGLRSSEISSAQMLESALLDLRPDDALVANSKKKMMRWDAKKRKFVKQTLEEATQSRGAKRVRSESGAGGAQKSSRPAGEMYAKWQKKTKREVGGFEEEGSSGGPAPNFKINRTVPEELKNAQQLRKLKAKKDDMKLKNMTKDKRKKIEKNNRDKRQKMQQEKRKLAPTKGSSKIRVIMRS